MQNHKHLIGSIITFILIFAALAFMVETQTPDALGPVGVAVFFLLLYAFIAQVINVILVAFSYAKNGVELGFVERITLSLASALPVMMLLALNTIRSVGVVDFILALVFGVVLVFYLRRR